MKPTVLLFSEPLGFSVNILESLLINGCKVLLVTSDFKTWQQNTSHITNSDDIKLIKPQKVSSEKIGNYLVYVEPHPKNLKALVAQADDLAKERNLKGYVITFDDPTYTNFPKPGDFKNVGVIYAKNLFGPRMDFDEKNSVSRVIASALSHKTLNVDLEEKIYPLFLGDAAKTVVKWLFSFGPVGEETQLTSTGILMKDFLVLVSSLEPGINYKAVGAVKASEETRPVKQHFLNTDYRKWLAETFTWYQLKKTKAKPKQIKPPKLPKSVKSKVKPGKVIVPILTLLLVAVSPLIMLLFSVISLYWTKSSMMKGKTERAQYGLAVSEVLARTAEVESTFFTKIPGVGLVYRPFVSFAYLVKNVSLVGKRGLAILKNSADLVNLTFSENSYDVANYADAVATDLAVVDQTLAFSQGEFKLYPKFTQGLNIAHLRLSLKEFGNLLGALPVLLGQTKKSTYLVLFQNNMELRPGGGFIGSFALVTFEGGRLVDISVSDVYSADGQLRGHVEPPAPLKRYLGEANWFLRDSNWDVDFPTNAQRAEWFLDKEISVPVDGVVAVDIKVAKDILSLLGPIKLPDYQSEVTADNLYEKTQSEVEGEFFPGSSKKASFLTALAHEMLAEITRNSGQNFLGLARILYNDLNERHIQIFMHDPAADRAITNLGWDGSFTSQPCPGTCFGDWLGVVEANVGVNKANYFIKRDYLLNVDLNRESVVKNLTVTFKNSANPAVGNKGIYKTYLRLVTPIGSTVTSAKGDESTFSGRREYGYYLEILPGETKKFNIVWEEKNIFPNYQIYWHKQAGMEGDNVALTVNGAVVYNTIFTKDIIWTNIP